MFRKYSPEISIFAIWILSLLINSNLPKPSTIPSPVSSTIPSPELSPTPSPVPSPTPSPELSPVPSPTPSPELSPTPSPVPSPTPSPELSPVPSPTPTTTYAPIDDVTVAEFSQWAEEHRFVQGWSFYANINRPENCWIGAGSIGLHHSLIDGEVENSHYFFRMMNEMNLKKAVAGALAICPIVNPKSNTVGYESEQKVQSLVVYMSLPLASTYEERRDRTRDIVDRFLQKRFGLSYEEFYSSLEPSINKTINGDGENTDGCYSQVVYLPKVHQVRIEYCPAFVTDTQSPVGVDERLILTF